MGHEQIDSYLLSFEIKEKMQLWLFTNRGRNIGYYGPVHVQGVNVSVYLFGGSAWLVVTFIGDNN